MTALIEAADGPLDPPSSRPRAGVLGGEVFGYRFSPREGAQRVALPVATPHRDAVTPATVLHWAFYADDTAAQPCYDARGVTRMYDHLTAISTAMNTLGWSNYANDHEDGNGQFEQNFQFAEALVTADRVITLRYLLSTIAAERGMIATFMPNRSPTAPAAGCTCTCH